jgi:hypothetical protein
MLEAKRGTQVHHASLGLGQVVATEVRAVHVYFPASRSRFATKLRLPEAGRYLRADGFEPDPWLGGLSAFQFDEQAGRWALTASCLSREEAIALYRPRAPKALARGEEGSKVATTDRRSRWASATERWHAQLGVDVIGRLLDDGELATAVRRIADFEKFVSPLLGKAEHGAMAQALSDPGSARPFLRALIPLLEASAPVRARFEAVSRATQALPGEPDQRWLVATLLPFVAAPGRHALLRPRATGQALERLGTALVPGDHPTWAVYADLRATSARLLEVLAPQGARDFADVECLLHATATAGARAPARGHPPSARRAAPRAAARSSS